MIKLLKFAIPVVILGGAIFGYTLYNKPHRDVESGDAAYELTAQELASAFVAGEAKANEKYLGQILLVSGEVTELIREEESFGLLLDGGSNGSVYCAFSEPPQVMAGDQVKVKGTCSGYLMDVVINDCLLINTVQ